MGEAALQSKIVKDLVKSGWLPVKVKLCNLNGHPDLVIYKAGKTIFIEVKDEGKEADPLQKHVHSLLRNQGFNVYVIDTWDRYVFIKHNYL